MLRELVAQTDAAHIVAVARMPGKVTAPGAERRAGDYLSVPAMTSAFAGVDTVVMISAPVVPGSDRVALHRNAIEAARVAGVRTLITTSVVGNGREEGTLFASTQAVNRDTEAAVRASGLGWVVLRNGLYLELDVNHVVAAGPDGTYSNPGAEGRAPYIGIDELAYATARVAIAGGHQGRTYNLVSESVTQADLIALVNEAFGLRVRYAAVGDEAYIETFLRRYPERGEIVARMLAGCFQAIRAGAFDVPSDFAAAAGRPPKTMREMVDDVRRKRATA